MSPALTRLYQLNKGELVEALEAAGENTEGSFEQLRARLRQYLIHTAAMGKPDETTTSETTTVTPPSIVVTEHEAAPTLLPIASVMDCVRKWGCHFDGTKDGRDFLERICELQEGYGITDDQLLRCLPELLKGQALLWHRSNRAGWTTWTDFEKNFRLFYIPTISRYDLEEEILQRKQKPGERAGDYLIGIQTLIRRHGQLPRDRQLELIHRNLLPEYRQYIRRKDCPTITALLETAVEYESITTDKKNRTSAAETTPTQRAPRSTLAAVTAGYDRETCCWRCGQRGHRRQECRQQARLFCSRCGQDGRLSRNCPCQPPAGNASRPGDGGASQPPAKLAPQ